MYRSKLISNLAGNVHKGGHKTFNKTKVISDFSYVTCVQNF